MGKLRQILSSLLIHFLQFPWKYYLSDRGLVALAVASLAISSLSFLPLT